jgi:uncharacterized membrane protein YcgQ (UPF0703/DUF1980 family)
VREQMRCCAADAVPIEIVMHLSESLPSLSLSELSDGKSWVKTTGKITFAEKSPGQYITVMQLTQPVEKIPPDPKQYVY